MSTAQNRFRLNAAAACCAWILAGAGLSGARTAPADQPSAPPTSLEQSLRVEIDRFVAADRASPPAPCQVLLVGSSSIVKWRDTLAGDMQPLAVINRGFGGSHIEYINLWFNEIVAPYRPRSIVFYAGENDLDAGKSPQRVVADFDAFMDMKTKALGATPVYFISVKPSKLRFAQFLSQSKVNDAIRERAAQRHDLRYIDVVPFMLEHGRPKDIYEADGLHMQRAGYEIWTRIVRAALFPNTDAEQRSCRARLGHSH
jgi:lysophospholipase L1-like esterase